MPLIQFDDVFSKNISKFAKNNPKRLTAVKKALRLFQKDPHHPSLHSEKLSGSAYWTIRVDHGNRLFFSWLDQENTAIFFFVGPHDAYKKNQEFSDSTLNN